MSRSNVNKRRFIHIGLSVGLLAVITTGCEDPVASGPDAMITPDGLGFDSMTPPVDAPVADAAVPLPDGSALDASVADAMDPDAAPADAMAPDAAAPDAAATDAAAPDAMPPDAMPPDAMPPDAGPVSCVQDIHGSHYLRTDNTVVYWAGSQTVITVAGGAALSGVTQIYSGSHHGCALKNDGTVWCWPINSLGNRNGQLGRGTTTFTTPSAEYFIATQVMENSGTSPAALANVDHIAGGSSRGYAASNTCAVLANGQLWCWGSPDSSGGGGGTLFNDGVTGNRAYAVPILAAAATPLTGVQAVSLGTRHACVIRDGTTNGEVWCWGSGIGGSLGQGDQSGRTYPSKVTLAGPADQLGAGADATCVRIADAVYCWGSNNSGQVGIGDHTLPANHDGCINYCKLTPKQVVDSVDAPLTGVTDLNMAYLSVCALRSDHTLWCWGRITTNQVDWAIPAVAGSNPVDNVAMHTTHGTGGYAQSLLWFTRDDKLLRPNSELTPLCP